MSIRELLQLARAKWWLLVSAVVVGGILAAGSVLLLPSQYISAARLLVATPHIDTSSLIPPGNLSPQQQAANFAGLATGSKIPQQVIDQLQLGEPVAKLLQRATVTVLTNTSIIQVSARDPDASKAQRIAQAFADDLVAAVPEVQKSSGASADQATITVTDPANLPEQPVASGVVSTIALGAVAGLVIGLLLVRLLAYLDASVRRRRELEQATGEPVLTSVEVTASGDRPALGNTEGSQADAYRVLRGVLQVSLDLGPAPTVVIAGIGAGAGASSTAANLAVALARGGRRTLLIDADLHEPTIGTLFGIPVDRPGVTDVLEGTITLDAAVVPGPVDGLQVLAAGRSLTDPSEKAQSPAMAALLAGVRGRYDVVLVDAPPALSCNDATALAAGADGTILVARFGRSRKADVATAAERLAGVRARLLGSVLVGVPVGGTGERTASTVEPARADQPIDA